MATPETRADGELAWSSNSDTGQRTVAAVQAGLTVRMIMTERNSLATCHPSDHVASLVAKNVDQFSFVPVVRDGKICGLYNAERWFEEIPPADARVEGDFDALTEDQVIGGEASILEFVLSAISQPARLVVSGGEIVGMVCLADLQKLPVRAALFGLVTALEMVMAERIQATCHEDSGEWLGLLSPGRRRKLKEKVVSLRKSDSFVSEILATEFADKADIIVKLSVLEGSKTKVREQLRDIEKLRNSLAHASPFGTTRDAAEKVPHTVEAISRIIGELRET